MLSTAPKIGTLRLWLRAHRGEDLPEWLSRGCPTDPRITRFIGTPGATEQRTWARLLADVGQRAGMGFVYGVIEARAAAWNSRSARLHGRGCATEAVGCVLAKTGLTPASADWQDSPARISTGQHFGL